MHTTQNLPIQSKNSLQTWTSPVHSRVAVKTKPQKKDDEIPSMKININARQTKTGTLNCMIVQKIK